MFGETFGIDMKTLGVTFIGMCFLNIWFLWWSSALIMFGLQVSALIWSYRKDYDDLLMWYVPWGDMLHGLFGYGVFVLYYFVR